MAVAQTPHKAGDTDDWLVVVRGMAHAVACVREGTSDAVCVLQSNSRFLSGAEQ
jgi:hypothetical protein